MSIVTLNDRGVRSVTTFGSLNTGSMIFIKKLTASSSANLSFVNGSSDVVLDSTYKEYLFTFKNIHPATDTADLFVKFRDGSTAYDATITTTVFRAYHTEADSTAFEYETSEDVAQGTSGQGIAYNIGSDNDQGVSGILHLFNPSSTTFVKHFICRMQNAHGSDLALDNFVAGYCNVTAAIDAVQFVMDTGNIDSGDICLYGIL
mgnify:CR=1 FL=1